MTCHGGLILLKKHLIFRDTEPFQLRSCILYHRRTAAEIELRVWHDIIAREEIGHATTNAPIRIILTQVDLISKIRILPPYAIELCLVETIYTRTYPEDEMRLYS